MHQRAEAFWANPRVRDLKNYVVKPSDPAKCKSNYRTPAGDPKAWKERRYASLATSEPDSERHSQETHIEGISQFVPLITPEEPRQGHGRPDGADAKAGDPSSHYCR